MKKKIFISILFFSIFIINAAISLKPVQGYKFGVPDAAKGIETEGQVKLYDDDEWNSHLGEGADNPDDLFDGDADIVGAKTKTKVVNWEKDEELIDFFKEFVLTADVEVEGTPEIENFNNVFDYIYDGVRGLSDPVSTSNPVHQLLDGVVTLNFQQNPGTPKYFVFANGTIANTTCAEYSFDSAIVNENYAEKLDGIILEREIWDYTDEDYDVEPDVDGKEANAPFLGDPRDWYDTYTKLRNLKYELMGEIEKVVNNILSFNTSLIYLRKYDPTSWNTLNSSIASQIPSTLGIPVPLIEEGGDNLPWLILDAGLNPTGENPLQQGQQGLYAVASLVGTSIPGKFGFLYQLLLEGLPVLTPEDDFLAKIVDEFDINDEDVEVAIPGLDPSLQIRGDVALDGSTIILKFEYVDGTVDPADPDNELKDFEVTFTYDEMGTQGAVVFKDGDEEFYRKEGLTIIPGFDTTILIGVSAFSTIALIYIFMKKRRL